MCREIHVRKNIYDKNLNKITNEIKLRGWTRKWAERYDRKSRKSKMRVLSCPICGANATYIFKSQHNYQVAACSNQTCAHLWLPEKEPNQGMHQRSQALNDESDQNLSEFGKRNDRLLKMFLHEIKWNGIENLQICDFGSGCAHIARSVKKTLKEKAQVTCVESNANVLAFYSNWGLEGKSNVNELADNKYDLIYMVEVIEHLDNPEHTLTCLKKKLKPKGMIFITTPEGRKNENETNAFDNPAHVHFFTESSLDKLLENCNLSKLKHVNRNIMHACLEDKRLSKADVIYAKLRDMKKSMGEIKNTIQRNNSKQKKEINDEANDFDILPQRYHLVGFTKCIEQY